MTAPPREHDVWAGLTFIRTLAILPCIFAAKVTQSFFRAAFMTVYILYAARHLHVTPAQWGLILGPGSVLAILGSSVTRRLSRRLGMGVTLIAGTVLFTVPLLVVPLIAGNHVMVVGALFLAEGVSGAGAMIQAITLGTIQASAIPDVVRARVMAAFTIAGRGMTPVGAGLAALLAWQVGVHATVFVATIDMSLSFLWLLTPTVRSLQKYEQLQPVAK